MPINIVNQEFFDQWNGNTAGNGSGLLTGNIGDEIEAHLDIEVSWSVRSGDDSSTAIFFTPDGIFGILELQDGSQWLDNGFAVNDIIDVHETTSFDGLYQLISIAGPIAKVSQYVNVPVNPIWGVTGTDNNAVVNGVTPITRIDYNFNLIPNTDEPFFESLIDDTVQSFAAKSLDGTNTRPLINQSASNAWLTGTALQIDDATTPNVVECGGVDASVGVHLDTGRTLGHVQFYTIKHTFTITPEFKAEYFDADGSYRHEDLFDVESFKYAYAVSGRYEDVSLSETRRQTTDSALSNVSQYIDYGNVGALNERLNGEAPYYTIDNLVLTNLDSVEVVDQLGAGTRTQVDVELLSLEANFTSSNVVEIRLYKIPLDQADEDDNYKETTSTYFDNYDYSSVRITANGTPLSGLSGVPLEKQNHIEDGATATLIGGSQIDLSFVIEAGFGSNKYALVVSTQDPSITDASSTDRNNALVQIDEAEDDLTDPSVLTTTIGQLEFAQTNPDNTTLLLTAYPEDNIVSVIDFAVDTAKNSLIQSISAVLIASHATEDDFELERNVFDVSGAIVSMGIQQINLSQDRSFKMPTGDIRKRISIQRDSVSDTGTFAAFRMLYPYKIRWEDFVENLNVNADIFFDALEQSNGLNQDWFRIAATAGWSIKFRFEIEIDNNGFTNNLSAEETITLVDYEDNTDWTIGIDTFDSTFTTNLSGATNATSDTGVRATFTYTGGETITTANSYVLLSAERYNIDGSDNIREINSLYANETDSPWESIVGGRLAKFDDIGGGVFTAEAIIKSGSFTDGSVKYSARIGPKDISVTIPPNAILQEDGFAWLQEDGSYIIQE